MILKIFKSKRSGEKHGLSPGISFAEYIHYDVLLKMISKFRSSYMQPNSTIPAKSSPVKWAWISLPDIKKLVTGNKVDWNDDAAIKNSGIRLYFSIHGEASDTLIDLPLGTDGKPDKLFENKNTLIFVMTKINGDNLIADRLEQGDEVLLFDGFNDAMNHSTICPPKCQGHLAI